MKKVFLLLLISFVSVAILSSCGGKKSQPAEITKLAEYKDGVFSFQYPENWLKSITPNQSVVAFSSDAGKTRFAKNDPEGDFGAKFLFKAVKLNEGENVDSIVKIEKEWDASIFNAAEKVMVDGVELTKQTYKFELKDGLFEGEIYYGTNDKKEFLSVIKFEAFGGTLSKFRTFIDEALKNTKLAKMPAKKEGEVQVVKVEAPPPSPTLANMKGDGFSIGIPDNFEINRGARKAAGVLAVYDYVGDRRADCNIMVEVLDGKDANIEKIAEALAKKLGTSSKGTTLGGEKAFAIDYSPVAGVKGRITLASKNGKIFRATINWSSEEEASYKSVFEKSIGSFKFN